VSQPSLAHFEVWAVSGKQARELSGLLSRLRAGSAPGLLAGLALRKVLLAATFH